LLLKYGIYQSKIPFTFVLLLKKKVSNRNSEEDEDVEGNVAKGSKKCKEVKLRNAEDDMLDQHVAKDSGEGTLLATLFLCY
jgi:hypothetical protein